jgi:antitoxin VapB
MALSIKNSAAENLARQLAEQTGETITEAIRTALEERLRRVSGRRRATRLADQLNEIALRCAALPVIDKRSEDEILGFDRRGLPK